jgi:enterobactin synthetase component D
VRDLVVDSPFPSTVSFAWLADEACPSPVLPEEANAFPEACQRRRQEFWLGRAAAHRCILALCGRSEQPIGRGSKGQPLWPAGLVGSITHTRGLALAAVARREHHRGLGLDVERRDRRVREDVGRLVALPTERAWISSAESDLRLKLLFSAKEAIFKALFPLGEVFLGYKDAELRWEPSQSGFVAHVLVDAAPGWPQGSELQVGTRVDDEFVLTWVCLPP